MYNHIKLVALDIDGTLLDSEANISKNTIDIVQELERRGFHIVLSTGRTFLSSINIMKKLSIKTPIISYNGGYVYIPQEGVILNTKIPLDISRVILEYGERNDLYVKVYIDDILHVKENDKESIRFSKNHGIEYNVVGRLVENIKQDVNMIVLFTKQKDVKLDTYLNKLNISITSSTPYCKEFLPYGISKASGLKLVTGYYGIDAREVLAIGNGLNDLEMLDFAGLGIAMKNSDPNLIKRWDNISSFSNDDEGVYHILKKL